MSISENHGALSKQLNRLKDNDGKVEDNFFKSLGFEYLFVKDGNNLPLLLDAFNEVKDTNHPVVVHCCTQKGKGYPYAEEKKEIWHWAYPFDIETGQFKTRVPDENYGAIAAKYLLEKMERDSDVVVVTASTPLCIGFNESARIKAGKQFVDVGIAEQNAVSMGAAMAKRGGKPVIATNSTFFQRAYDQIEQEMCINKCPATMIVTHASIYGHTNNTLAGLYDIALLSNIQNLIYLAPTNKEEYLAMLDWSIEQKSLPVAIRVPWNGVYHSNRIVLKDYSHVKYEIVKTGEKIAVIGLGGFYQLAEDVIDKLESIGIDATLINPRFITGLDAKTLDELKKNHSLVVTLEDGILNGGFGSKIAQYYGMSEIKVMNKGFYIDIPTRWKPFEIMEKNRLKVEQIVEDILNNVKVDKNI
jgi:1-deoxy-D-xylulose-5-phosphate synthase